MGSGTLAGIVLALASYEALAFGALLLLLAPAWLLSRLRLPVGSAGVVSPVASPGPGAAGRADSAADRRGEVDTLE